jgi:putative addiction module killer protein
VGFENVEVGAAERVPFGHDNRRVGDFQDGFVGAIWICNLYSIEYNQHMFTVKPLPDFIEWLEGINDKLTAMRLRKRLRKVMLGNLGDVKPVGEGVFEMREFFGPGWRMYYVQRGEVLIVLLGGGDKSTQQADIAAAIALSKTLEGV